MILSLSHISKSFSSVNALTDVSFSVSGGEVHALLGENGAGKTTLIHIAYGLLRPDSGTVAQTGSRLGLVHQHFTSIPAFTVAENIALAAGWPETGCRAEARAAHVIARLGLPLDPVARVADLSVQLKQRLEIVKALATDANVLLLDEPTAVLAPREVEELLHLIRSFAANGGAVVLITHKLHEAMAVADRVTVLRQGTVTLSGPMASETPASLARAMMGKDARERGQESEHTGESTRERAPGRDGVRVVLTGVGGPIELRAGELVGIAAIEGNGQRELLRAVAGLNASPLVRSPSGDVAFIPEDRTAEALIPEFTLAENLLLAGLPRSTTVIDWTAIAERARRLLEVGEVRATGPDALAKELSGGNQQRFIVARALDTAPAVIVAENPTRGLDVHATAVVHQRLREAANQGACVLVHSADLDEVLDLSDRILVMAAGLITALPRDASRDDVGDAMLGISAVKG